MPTKILIFIGLLLSSCVLKAQDIKRIATTATDIAYVAQKDRMYATVSNSSTDPLYRNRLIVIDPNFGTIVASYFVGSDPVTVTATDDGKFLYIGLRGAGSYVKFDVNTNTVANTYSVGNGVNISDPAYVEQIQTLPGLPNTVAIVRRNSCCSPRHEGVAVYDNGIRRTTTTPGHTGANSIAATNDPNVLWGYNNETTEFGLRKLKIDANGITVDATYTGLVSGFGDRIKYFNGRIYANTGSVIDVSGATPSKIGQLSISGYNGRDLVADTAGIFFALGGSPTRIVKFDKTTFTQTEEWPILNLNTDVYKMIQWGSSRELRFAFTSAAAIVIMRQCTSTVQATPSVLTPNGTAVCQNDSLKLTASGNFDNFIWSNGAIGKEIYVKESGLYSVATSDATGCLSKYSPSVPVTFESKPWPPYIYPSSGASFCVGGSVRLSASASSGGTVQWSNGETGNEVQVRQAGSYTCRFISNAGCKSDLSTPVFVAQRSDSVPPRPKIVITGDTTFCAGTSSVTLTVSPQSTNYTYSWSNGYSTSSITLKDAYSSGNYVVKLISPTGCESDFSNTVGVRINTSPSAPRIFVNGKNLASSEETGNQWYLNGQILVGVTQQFIIATQSGFYQVRVIRNNCPSPLSEIANVLVGTKDLTDDPTIQLLPNPANEDVLVSFRENFVQSVEIVDVNGVVHLQQTVDPKSTTTRFDIGHLTGGVYIVRFKNDKKQVVQLKKLIKV